jgi:hypothetical protein
MRGGGTGLVLIIAALAAASAPARADDDPSTIASELAGKPTALQGVEVSAARSCLKPRDPPDRDVPAPKVVSTYPAQGQVVRPGLLILRLTFDLPMACRGALGNRMFGANPCVIDGRQTWVQSRDRLNLRVLCRLEPGKRYDLWVNRQATDDFQGLGGLKPEPYELTFAASGDPPVATVEDAAAQDPRPAP